MPRRVAGSETNLKPRFAHGNRLPGNEREVGRGKGLLENEAEERAPLLCVVVHRPIGRVQVDRHAGDEPPERGNPLDVIEVGVRKVDGSDAPPPAPGRLDHRRGSRTGINGHPRSGPGAEGNIGVLTERPRGKAVDLDGERTADVEGRGRQTVNELPHPHPPVATGLVNVNPEPIMLVT